jgi:enoyl-CoA hydratase/carnithine racemase
LKHLLTALFYSDLVVASPQASFGLPEANVGLYAAAGGLPRIVRQVGLVIASEIALAGRKLSAQEALQFQLINKISATPESVIQEAVDLALKVAALSPDAIIVSRSGLREAWENGSVERATQVTEERYAKRMMASPNTLIGLAAFAAKQKPQWVPSKL